MELALPFTPEGAATGGVGLALLYWLWREFRRARSEDKRDGAEEKFRDDLMAMNRELVVRADKFAAERNEERELRVKAESEVQRLRAHIVAVSRRCTHPQQCGISVEVQRAEG